MLLVQPAVHAFTGAGSRTRTGPGVEVHRGPKGSVSSILAWTLAVILVACSLALITLPGRAFAASAPLVLRIGVVNFYIATLNPMRMTLQDEYVVAYNVYSTLLTYDKSYNEVGDLAYNWTLASDQVTWTFHLVQGAYFLDPMQPGNTSHPVTADDVVFTYNLQINQTASGFHSYATEMLAVEKVDAYTVRIITKQPSAVLTTAAAEIPILPKYIWSAIANPVNYAPAYPIGSSAMYYDYSNSSLGSAIILRKNPSYYGPAYYGRRVQPDAVEFIGYQSAAQMANAFLTGANALNAIERLDPSTYTGALGTWTPKWAVDQGFVGEISANVMTTALRSQLVASGYTRFGSGSNNQILATNLTVRQAIAMSINKSALVRDALSGLGNVADTLVPDSNPWHYAIPPNERFRFDPSAARALLNSAGWSYDGSGALNPSATPLYQAGGTNPLVFRFFVSNTPVFVRAAQDIVPWLAQAGVETTKVNGTPGFSAYGITQMNTAWLIADYDLWLWNWIFSPASDPSVDILYVETTMAIGTSSDNFYSNATYDAYYNQSLTETNALARHALVDTMQQMVYRDASYILPFYQFDLFAALDPTSASSVTTPRWSNWGNWTQDPGLVPDSDLPNLWFQIQPPAPDTVPPITSLSLTGTAGANGWYDSSVVVTLSATDDLTGIASTMYSLDGGLWQTYAAAFTIATDGNHTLDYRSTDGAGNVEPTHVVSIHVDTKAPNVAATLNGTLGESGWYVSSVTVNLTATDATSGVASFSYRIDGGSWTGYTAPFVIADGVHLLQYGATDVAGNAAVPTNLTLRIDTVPPTLGDLAPSGRVTASTVNVTWVGSDAASGIANYSVSVDGEAFQNVGTQSHAVLDLPDGTHTITVRATDGAGHTTDRTTTVTVDTNIFSFTGPYGGLPTMAVVIVAVVVAILLAWFWRRRKTTQPPGEQPPAAPPAG